MIHLLTALEQHYRSNPEVIYLLGYFRRRMKRAGQAELDEMDLALRTMNNRRLGNVGGEQANRQLTIFGDSYAGQ